jgi:hypothetical protein
VNNKQNHVSEAIRDFAEKHITPAPADYEVIDVEVKLVTDVLSSYGSELFNNIQGVIDMRGGNLPFSEDELQKYLSLLVRLRVAYVNNKRVPYRPTDLIAVPAFVSVVLQNLGVVHHLELGLELRPVINGDNCETWSEEDLRLMTKVSRGITALGNYGLEYAKGYDRMKEGSFDFMTMSVLKDKVMGITREAHPVYALLASVLNLTGIEIALSPRIIYGSITHFKRLVAHLATLKS